MDGILTASHIHTDQRTSSSLNEIGLMNSRGAIYASNRHNILNRMPLSQRSYPTKRSYLPTSRREQFATFLIVLNVLVFFSSLKSRYSIPSDSSSESLDVRPPVVRLATGEEYKIFNGGWTENGSCLCGTDSYCMCNPSLAIDLVIADSEDDNYVWLVKRKDTGQYATMGGFVQVGESTEEATIRELKEETNIDVPSSALSLIGIYGDPARDKRRHTISAVYLAKLPKDAKPEAGDDVKAVVRVDITDENVLIPENFFADHLTILKDYRDRKKAGVETGSVRGDLEKGGAFSRSVCSSNYFVE